MRLLFVKIPKTASTFFEKNFHNRYGKFDDKIVKVHSVDHAWLYTTVINKADNFQYSYYPVQHKEFRNVLMPEYQIETNDVIVATIRNPFDLFFSYFYSNWGHCRDYYGFSLETFTKEDFQKFVDIYLDENQRFHTPPFKKSLFSQLKDKDGNWITDKNSIFIKYENFKEDILKFRDLVKIKLTFPVENVMNKSKAKPDFTWKTAYRKDQIDKLNELWKDDLEYFNYSFDDEDIDDAILLNFKLKQSDFDENKEFWLDLIKTYNIEASVLKKLG